ncbi:MAG: universal stress protein [Candidatus Kapaibacteriales bacterium]
MVEYKNILVPIDFSPGSDFALQHAKKLIDRNGCTVHLVHVVEPTTPPVGLGLGPEMYVGLEKDLSEASVRKLDNMCKDLNNQGYTTKNRSLKGKASTEITDYASENDIDLIVINTHGASGIEHFLFGSTTEKVLRKAKCPVMVVRKKG